MSYDSTRWRGSARPRIPDPLDRTGVARYAYDTADAAIAEGRGLLVIGDVGVGKTALLAYAEREIIRRAPRNASSRVRAAWLDDPSWWATAPELIDDVRAGWDLAKQYGNYRLGAAYDARGLAGMVKCLFIDDLGAEKTTGAETIIDIIDERYRRELPTWISTNLNEETLLDRYGRRMISRLMHRTQSLLMLGTDRRIPYGQ